MTDQDLAALPEFARTAMAQMQRVIEEHAYMSGALQTLVPDAHSPREVLAALARLKDAEPGHWGMVGMALSEVRQAEAERWGQENRPTMRVEGGPND